MEYSNIEKKELSADLATIKSEINQEYKTIIQSIEKYGGFYIGRYEISSINNQLQVVKGGELNSFSDWKDLYSKTKLLKGENENLFTTIIPTSLYDQTLEWYVKTQSKTYEEISENSTFWGNFNNSSFNYKNSLGENKNKLSGTSIKIPTGSTEFTKINNIYDLASNVWEYTTLGYDNRFIITKGGGYTNYGNISASYIFDEENDTVYEKGSRAVLIIDIKENTNKNVIDKNVQTTTENVVDKNEQAPTNDIVNENVSTITENGIDENISTTSENVVTE